MCVIHAHIYAHINVHELLLFLIITKVYIFIALKASGHHRIATIVSMKNSSEGLLV